MKQFLRTAVHGMRSGKPSGPSSLRRCGLLGRQSPTTKSSKEKPNQTPRLRLSLPKKRRCPPLAERLAISVTADEIESLYARAIEEGDLDRAEVWANALLRLNDPAEPVDA
jgi:hypothetical protein